jgi:hypothetical protein
MQAPSLLHFMKLEHKKIFFDEIFFGRKKNF